MKEAGDSSELEKPDILEQGQPFNLYTEIHLLNGHSDIVRKLIKLDNKRFASAADDATVIIWDIETGQKLLTLQGHSLPITCIMTLNAPQGLDRPILLLTGSSDRQIRVWNVDSGKCLHVATEHSGSVRCLIPLRDQCLFASGGEEICVWSKLGRLQHKYIRKSEFAPVIAMIFIQKDRLISASDKILEVYRLYDIELDDGTESQKLSFERILDSHREPIQSLISISDKMFASGSLDGTFNIWSAISLNLKHCVCSEHNYEMDKKLYPFSIQHMLCEEQRYIFLTTGSGFCIYDIQTSKFLVKKSVAHYSKILHLGLVCNGHYLATCSEDGSLRLWGTKPELKSPMSELRSPVTKTPMSHVERFFRVTQSKTPNAIPAMEPDLLGECLGHSGAVQMFLDFGNDGLVTCSVDGMMIAWKNHEYEEMKRCTQILQLQQTDQFIT